MSAGIYKITNKENGKCYIGQSINLEKRIRVYEQLKCNNQPKIYNAIKKYGFDMFDVDYLYQTEKNKEDIFDILNELEEKYIKEFDCIKSGYNIMTGGDNSRHSEETKLKMSLSRIGRRTRKDYTFSQETKNKLSIAGRNITDDTRKKMSNSRIGNKYCLGYKHTIETKNKMSLSRIGKGKKIIQYDINMIEIKEWNTIIEASKALNIHRDTIRKNLKNKTKSTKGFIFKYKKNNI